MRIARLLYLLLSFLLCVPALFCQTASVPAGPLELITDNAHVLVTPEQRTVAIKLLNRARRNYNLHEERRPFTLKASFSSNGQSLYEGAGSMEESWLSERTWRWTAQIGDVSAGRSSYGGHAYSTSGSEIVPMRIYMVRDTIFATGPGPISKQIIRAANVNYKGNEIICILLSESVPPTPAPRLWGETEYCIDPHTGLLQTWSEAPGIYVTYDYNEAIEFHGHTLARQISFVEDGKNILNLHLDSLEETGTLDPGSFKPTPEMLAQGEALNMPPPIRFPILAASAAQASDRYSIQPVIVHATIDGKKGKIIEAEALQNSNPYLTNEALNLVKGSSNSAMGMEREVFINVRLRLQRPARAQNSSH